MSERVNSFWSYIIILMTLLGVLLTINQVYFLNLFGLSLINSAFLFFLLTFFLSFVFITYPFNRHKKYNKVPLYDVALFLLTIVTTSYLGLNGENITNLGWDIYAPSLPTTAGIVLWVLVLEALRRTAGLTVAIIALLFSLMPLVSGQMPVSFLRGVSMDFLTTARLHSMGVDSILGLPIQAAGTILVGFLIFGVTLQETGGAKFFYELAQSMFGRSRGGAAKVTTVSSGFMGMMSGSAVSNVLTTGPMTIPVMKETGFSAEFAGSVEATASSGGSITPPVMGTAAFLMVTFVGVPYSEIVLAAFLPAFLYYLGILVQVDGYAGKKGLKGLDKSEIPNIVRVLKQGWPYLFALIILIVFLVTFQLEAQAPFYTIAALLFISFLRKENRIGLKGLKRIVLDSGKIISEILAILAGVGLIVGGLSLTGVSLSLARELVHMVGDNVYLILFAGAITSLILGMGMTISAVYVFLAIVLAPALITEGVNPIAAHLYVIYWASVSYITPPVALASFAAAGIAGANPMKTSLVAMKLGGVKYLVPLIFVFNPNVLAQGTLESYVVVIFTSTIGIIILASALEGWMAFINKRLTFVERILAIAISLPLFMSNYIYIAFALIATVLFLLWLKVKPDIKV